MFSILNLLINNPKLTANELAERLEVSKRTIYRDIDALNMAGVPVVSFPGQGGGLGILEGFKLDNKFLSIDEMEKIWIGLNALKSIDLENDINILITKLIPKDNSEIFESMDTIIDLSSWFTDNSFQTYLSEFKKAIKMQRVVSIEYQAMNGNSKRKVEPNKLIFKYSSWYLYAYCLCRKEFRLFKINRITSFTILDDIFNIRDYKKDDITLLFKNNYFLSESRKYLFKIVLQYKNNDEAFLMEKIGVQKFKFDIDKKTISFETMDYLWLLDFVIGLKDKVKVIEPPALIKDIKEIIEKIHTFYQES